MSTALRERLTVFHLDDERGFRGGERQLLYLASALRSAGHENVICCRAESALEREAVARGFEVFVLPFASEFDVVSAHRLARAAARRHRAVVHAHTGHTVGIAATCRLLGGPPAIAHRRGASKLRRGFSRWLKYDRVARVVAVSNAIEGILTSSGLAAERITVVPDCIPISPAEWTAAGYVQPRFSPASAEQRENARRALADAYGIDPAAAWIGNLAALVPLKDHATLIAAAESVLRQRPNTVFLIAGEGPERERLLADIERRGLTGRVVLVGHYDAAALFAALDIFALTSCREGMGSVLLEAALCGVPVVATAAGGIPEVVRDGVTGLLVTPRDHEGLALGITRLLDEPAYARQLATSARQAVDQYGLTATVQRMKAIYRATLAPSPVRETIRFASARTTGRAWSLLAAMLLLVAGTSAMRIAQSRAPAPDGLPAVGAAAQQSALYGRPRESRHMEHGIWFDGGFSDISDSDLWRILSDLEVVEALPSAEPDVAADRLQGIEPPLPARRAQSTSGL